ncbi:transcriptional regulator Myc-2-like [Centropristis striata]|uniref:transcriptional regulator Myc-2-like n=1 Tax=Centropristis striata TaxID=184440 RepID=UPI0027E17134|nr:transcriptional regulator Myc-2-like [Centropristis striata]
MPLVLTMSSGNYDYDYDTVQPYFLDGEEEDFYLPPRSQLLPGPGEDIWKKFELLPTPPLSPRRSPALSDVPPLSAAEHLEAVSELLDGDCNPSAALLQSFIIQDCMWSSSFAAATKLEKVVSERLALLRARRPNTETESSTTSNDIATADRAAEQQVDTGYLQDLHTAATDCIDPSVVFPYTTLSEKSEGGTGVEAELVVDPQPLSSSDSESEEEEEEEDEQQEEEEEEEEEIDVVTVDRRRLSGRSDGSRPDASSLVRKRSHFSIHQHNYAAQQPSAAPQQPAGKRMKTEIGCAAPRQSGVRRCWSPPSDGEDNNDKRRTHNVLERQRRNELRRSFVALRDQVPAVANNDKAAKVAILKKATEFIWEVREDERRLLRTKDELRKRSRELRQRLEQLRTLH